LSRDRVRGGRMQGEEKGRLEGYNMDVSHSSSGEEPKVRRAISPIPLKGKKKRLFASPAREAEHAGRDSIGCRRR